MKTMIYTMKNSLNICLARAYTAAQRAKQKLREDAGQLIAENGLLIAVIIGIVAIIAALLISYIRTDFFTTLKSKIDDFFNAT